MKTSHLFLTATTLMLLHQSVNAEIQVRPRAALGFASYELSTDNSDLASNSYMTLGIGATLMATGN